VAVTVEIAVNDSSRKKRAHWAMRAGITLLAGALLMAHAWQAASPAGPPGEPSSTSKLVSLPAASSIQIAFEETRNIRSAVFHRQRTLLQSPFLNTRIP
jgi:hypothetical protein